MKKITDVSELNSAVSRHFVKNVSTNNFTSEKAYLNEIEAGNLYIEEDTEHLFILRKRDGFYIVNYYIHGNFRFPEELNGEKLVVEIPYKRETDIPTCFEKFGFRLYLERIRMTAKKSETNGKAEFVKESDAKKAYKLITDNFDKTSGCIPPFCDFIKDVKDNKVLGYGDKAILHFSTKGKSSEIRHLVVDEKERGRGIASELIKTYFEKTDCVKYQVWLTKDNQPAEKTYKKHGYEQDGFCSRVYTKGI